MYQAFIFHNYIKTEFNNVKWQKKQSQAKRCVNAVLFFNYTHIIRNTIEILMNYKHRSRASYEVK